MDHPEDFGLLLPTLKELKLPRASAAGTFARGQSAVANLTRLKDDSFLYSRRLFFSVPISEIGNQPANTTVLRMNIASITA
jgi:hypothetical protein